MRKKTNPIPVNPIANLFSTGISIGKASVEDLSTLDDADLRTLKLAEQSHRHDYHLFFLQEHGNTSLEIDFLKHEIGPLSVVYIHPNQVHRILAVQKVTIGFLAIDNEHLNPEYLNLLEDIAPTKPLSLTKEAFFLISGIASLCVKISERNHDKLQHSSLKDSCNAMVSLVVSQYLEQSKHSLKFSRFEVISKAFKLALEDGFTTTKSPAAYAQKLNISTAYLNECVKTTTGHSVTYHIQQRVVLEAKRLLYYSDKSVKEIANQLGYEDNLYFSRLFTKVTGATPLTFRNKNSD